MKKLTIEIDLESEEVLDAYLEASKILALLKANGDMKVTKVEIKSPSISTFPGGGFISTAPGLR